LAFGEVLRGEPRSDFFKNMLTLVSGTGLAQIVPLFYILLLMIDSDRQRSKGLNLSRANTVFLGFTVLYVLLGFLWSSSTGSYIRHLIYLGCGIVASLAALNELIASKQRKLILKALSLKPYA
jgi:hypothetical protein